MAELILHNYYRSSTSFRVRAALALKGLPYEYRSYHLRKGEQRSGVMLGLNRQGLVPALQLPDGSSLTQSLAIMEWLEEAHPTPPLLPTDALGRARVRSLAQMIACDIHPLNNLRVLRQLKIDFGADDSAVANWFRHWVATTFEPLEYRLAHEAETGDFCHGDTPGMADICLAAQVINNARFEVDMTPYPVINAIHASCMALDAFDAAKPASQPDAE